MYYKINKIINFRDDDGKVWNSLDPDKSVRLSIIPAKIFSYLLENSKNIVSRNELLDNIWDKNGLQASNNSLSQNISILRKTLQDMGADNDIIVTLPKVGFRINESISVEIDKKTTQEPTGSEIPPDAIRSLSVFSANRYKVKAISIVASIIISIFLILLLLQTGKYQDNFSIKKEQLYMMGNIDSCYIYTFNKHSGEFNEKNMKIASKMINDYIPCIKNALFIFQADDNKIYNDIGRAFITRCITSTPEGKIYSSCQDVYINEH